MDANTTLKRQEQRPPSSYGSMKSDSDDEEEGDNEEAAQAFSSPFPVVLPGSSDHEKTGLLVFRSESPETLYTMTTQTKPSGAVVIETSSSDFDEFSEYEEVEHMDELLASYSPERLEPVEPDDTNQTDNSQPGKLHPEQDLSHIFKSIQNIMTGLTSEELCLFKMSFSRWKPGIGMEGDILDFVDRILENLGQDDALSYTIRTLESINKKPEADQLQNQCKRALIRSHLKEYLIRKHKAIHEGIVQAGKQRLLDNFYVEPQISTCGYGGVDPSHELRPHPPSPLQVPSADTFVGVNNLFRLQKDYGQPVRTVLTTGIPGIGMTVSVGKFSLDWAEQRANKDLQFVIKLSFRAFWYLRKSNSASQEMSIMEVIEFYHPECTEMKYLEEEDCKFLIIMDSLDCYQAPLDWENAPVINDNYTKAHPDILIVNIIRGTVLRGARVWILGRRAAVSQIPSKFIDIVTEIQGFSDEMKDDYLTKHFDDAELARKIVAHYKRLPMLIVLARQPFVCWIMATVFERFYRNQDYGLHPPRLTPFYLNILIIQTNRRLQFYNGKRENDLKWSSDDKQLLTKMGKMAFKMLERNTSVFFERDVKECGLKLAEVTVFSGICTELPTAGPGGRRTFCFIHFTFQEFMAALYVFLMFHSESKSVLGSGVLTKIFKPKNQIKSAAGLVQCAVERTLSSPLGHYDMFLRFLCGLLSPDCHDKLLCGFFFRHDTPKISGLDEAAQLLQKAIKTAQEKNRDRAENLKECFREMTQKDE